ncbi:TetR/AcrR family transcriptional regulator [Erysipelotrichaceae bacterium RD49]|nr:TetR/AcrR family transcriptional regulator [Erysipelotrichaceae bacterium RD49]
MPTKIQQNKALKRHNLIQAAYELFTKHDVQDVSIADITNQAGVAKGTFYLFFKDKYDIRDHLIAAESRKVLMQAIEELEKNDFRNLQDAVVFMINQILNQLISNPLLLKLIRRNLSFGLFHKHLASTMIEGDIDLAERFNTLALQCGYHYQQPKIVFAMILELTGSICYNSIVENQPAPIETVKPALFEAIRAILATAAQEAPQEYNAQASFSFDSPLH